MTASLAQPPLAARASLTRRLLRRPLGIASLVYLALLTIVVLAGRVIAPYDANQTSFDLVLAGPNAEHLLGGDSAGRDVLSRLLSATQTSVAAALVALVTAMCIGVIAGLLAGYYRGVLDAALSWITSLTMALPAIVVLLAARAIVGPSLWWSMLVFGVLLSPSFFRLVYSSVSAIRKELFVDAAKVSGLTDGRILARHVLSAVRAPIIIQAAVVAGLAIAVQSGLEFLGLGDMSTPTWGSMLNEGFIEIYSTPLLIFWPALLISATCVALTLFSNVMRDELELVPRAPRKRRAAGLVASPAEPPADVDSVATLVRPDDIFTAALSPEPLLRVSGLRVGYRQADGSDREVVHGVSFDVRPGEVHGLVGESGSGKSQTAFSILGLLPQGGAVTGGSIRFDGTELVGASPKVANSLLGCEIGYIPQEPMSNLDPSFTIGSQLVEPLKIVMGMSAADARRRALELLDRVGIPDPRRTFDAYPFEVSGGMAQRVLIAGAVSTDPRLIIADEPTTALDVTVQAEVLDLLRELQQERSMSMVLVTHNFGVVSDLCDRMSVMRGGRLVEQGPVRTVLRDPSHDYTRALLGAILGEGPARGPAPHLTEGTPA